MARRAAGWVVLLLLALLLPSHARRLKQIAKNNAVGPEDTIITYYNGGLFEDEACDGSASAEGVAGCAEFLVEYAPIDLTQYEVYFQTQKYENFGNASAITFQGFEWSIESKDPSASERKLMVAMGAAREPLAAEDCVLSIVSGNRCNSTDVYLMYGTGLNDSWVPDSTDEYPSVVTLAEDEDGFTGSHVAPSDEHWYFIDEDQMQALLTQTNEDASPTFVAFFATVANHDVIIDHATILGIEPKS